MAVLLNSLSCPPSTSKPRMLIGKQFVSPKLLGSGVVGSRSTRKRNRVKALFFNPIEEPIVREALKEPVAFMGGVFAGLLRLDLNDDPLKEWVSRTVEASGITTEEIEAEGSKPEEEEVPQQIEIE